MIGDVSGMGVLVCSNELTKGAGNVGYRNKVVVLVVLVCHRTREGMTGWRHLVGMHCALLGRRWACVAIPTFRPRWWGVLYH